MRPSPSAITSALITKLLANPALMALTPDGVFKDVAGASMAAGSSRPTRFVIVSLVIARQVRVFQKRAFVEALYLVEARMRTIGGAAANVTAAADAIDVLLDPQPPAGPATLTIPGFALMAMYQDEATEQTEFDDADPSIQWHRCGGRYRIWAAPTS
jgi:hypothetical protein